MNSKDPFIETVSRLVIALIRYTSLYKINIYSKEKLFEKAINLVTAEPEFSSKETLTVLFLLPKLIIRLEDSLDDYALSELLEAIEQSGKAPREFVKLMQVEDLDVTKLLLDVIEDSTNVSDNELSSYMTEYSDKKTIVDDSIKEVGQRVTIIHPLLTNMLVTAEGVQMPSLSKHVAAVPELMDLTAIVIAVDCDTHTYLCGGCDKNHSADVRIAFEDYSMEFYIDNNFIRAVNEHDQN